MGGNMFLKLIYLFFGKLSQKQKEDLVNTLAILVKAGAEGAVKGGTR